MTIVILTRSEFLPNKGFSAIVRSLNSSLKLNYSHKKIRINTNPHYIDSISLTPREIQINQPQVKKKHTLKERNATTISVNEHTHTFTPGI